MLANLSNLFHTKMPTHYTLLNVLMNKDRYVKHHRKKDQVVQWDWLVFYLFMIIQRICNHHNFSWYGLINGASTWKHNGGNMDVHLGLYLSRQSIVGKLKVKFSCTRVKRMIVKRLAKELITIGLFDNTQLMRLIKYQREGHSSIASIVTSLLFLLANIPKHHGSRCQHSQHRLLHRALWCYNQNTFGKHWWTFRYTQPSPIWSGFQQE